MTVKLAINGPIISSEEKWIYDWFDEEATCAKDISSKLPTTGEDLEITINSFGGYVDQGAEIYTILRDYSGTVVMNIVAAYSAASIIAMAGDRVRMSPVGRMMIHNASAENWGDWHDMEKMSEILQNANQAMSNAYAQKTGRSVEEVLEMMDSEKWLTADEAVELGFADEIMFSDSSQQRLVANIGSGLLSKNVVEKARSMLKMQQEELPEQKSVDIDALAEKVVQKLELEKAINLAIDNRDAKGQGPAKQKSLLGKLRKEG